MLCYAFQILQEQGYRKMETEAFENTSELFAAVLVQGSKHLVHKGLLKEYEETTRISSSLKGKVDITGSIKQRTQLKKQMCIVYDEFTENIKMNRVLKSTLLLLLQADISRKQKLDIKKMLVYFHNIESLNLKEVTWKFTYHKNSRTYRMLMGICYLTVKGLLQTQKDGSVMLMDFLDEQRMSRLYEKFLLEYFKKEHPQLHPCSKRISWQLDDDFDEMLPVMQSDIILYGTRKTLIIDAKYYASALQSRFGIQSLHSANLYQIFTYVKNQQAQDLTVEVEGMLLYAKAEEDIPLHHSYRMSGNVISADSLDLSRPFSEISAQLKEIAGRLLENGD
jgi:5-methylcytosine-specific restriction enzyme subunit McrC